MRSFKCWAIAALALSACGGNDSNGNNDNSASYTVGGTLTDLTGTVVLTNNGGDDLTLTQNGDFTFATSVAQGGAYLVAVKTQPASQTCSVADGSGTVGSANVTNVTVTCTTNATPTHTVGGAVTGATGTIVLTNNGGDPLTLEGDSTFTFTTPVAEGATYDVDVETPPANQTCEVENDSGTMGTANVTNVTVTCTTNGTATHTISATVTGLWGTVVLTNTSSGDEVTVIRDATHDENWNSPPTVSFATPVAENGPYDVEVTTQPSGNYHTTCTVSNGTGTVGTADVNVQVVCTGFGAACTTSDDCSGTYSHCGHVNNIPDGCTLSPCGDDDANCPVGSNGVQNCNSSNFCRW